MKAFIKSLCIEIFQQYTRWSNFGGKKGRKYHTENSLGELVSSSDILKQKISKCGGTN